MNRTSERKHCDLLEPISEEFADRILRNAEIQDFCRPRGVDLGIIVSNLRLTVEQRLENLKALIEIQCAIRNAPWVESSKK